MRTHRKIAVGLLGKVLPPQLTQRLRVPAGPVRGQAGGHALAAAGQAENDEPHPQVVVALGLRTTNCEPCNPSV